MGKLSHWDQYSCNIVKARGKGAFEGCYTEHTRDTCKLVQAAHTEMAQVCTGVQVTMRTSLFAPLVPSLQKLPSLCYLIIVTLLTLNWHGYKSWEVWGDSWADLSSVKCHFITQPHEALLMWAVERWWWGCRRCMFSENFITCLNTQALSWLLSLYNNISSSQDSCPEWY